MRHRPVMKPNRGTSRGYEKEYFAPIAEVEDGHFWFRSRNRAIGTLVRQLTREFDPGYRVLEVGCGTGAVLRTLDEACTPGAVVGMDLFREGLALARLRGGGRFRSCREMPRHLRFESGSR